MKNSERISYSVAIRTLGTSGEKYEKLIDSILKQTVQPEKIIVVLPEGYSAPQYKTEYVEIVHSQKGMIIQRLKALEYITSKYTLFCDDDVEFDELFVEKLAKPLQEGKFYCSAGPLLEFFPPKSTKYLLASILGGACVMLHGKKNTYVRILKTGGWSYNHDIDMEKTKYYYTESLPWTCFFIDTDVMKLIHFEDEMWSELHGYAAFEDRAMFYKLLKNGYKSCVVSDAVYIHNDGKTSVKELKLEPLYARSFNHYVFWHRYIYMLEFGVNKMIARICIAYYMHIQKIYNWLRLKRGNISREAYSVILNGFKDARKYVNSAEYKRLPSVIILEK